MNTLFLDNFIFWVVAFLALMFSIIILVKRIWLPYSKFLVLLVSFYIFLNFLSLFNMPNWIKNIGYGISFLVFPVLDGITTNIALTKYGGKEANPIMAWVIKKIGIRFAMFIPLIIFFFFVLFYWQTTNSSTLFGLSIVYLAVIINNVIVIQRNKKKQNGTRQNELTIT